MLTRPEGGVQAQLLGVQSQGRQAFRLDPPTVPVDQVPQWFPSPQVERLVQEVRGAVRLPQLQELPGPLDEALEAAGVELLVSDREPVALRERSRWTAIRAACAAA